MQTILAMNVRDVMTPHPACCTSGTPLDAVAKLMLDNDCGEIPVVDDLVTLRPLGVVTDRDICCRALAFGKNPLELTAEDCMSTPCVTVHEDEHIDAACKLIERHRIRRVPVIDGAGTLCGIVAQADLAAQLKPGAVGEVVRAVSRRHTAPR